MFIMGGGGGWGPVEGWTPSPMIWTQLPGYHTLFNTIFPDVRTPTYCSFSAVALISEPHLKLQKRFAWKLCTTFIIQILLQKEIQNRNLYHKRAMAEKSSLSASGIKLHNGWWKRGEGIWKYSTTHSGWVNKIAPPPLLQ